VGIGDDAEDGILDFGVLLLDDIGVLGEGMWMVLAL
jgi:hypothetical protein